MNKAFHMIWVQKHSHGWHWRPQQSWRLLGAQLLCSPARPAPLGTKQHGSPLLWRAGSCCSRGHLLSALRSHKQNQKDCISANSPPKGSPEQDATDSCFKGQTSLEPPLHALPLNRNILTQGTLSPESAIKVKHPGQCQNVRQCTETSS